MNCGLWFVCGLSLASCAFVVCLTLFYLWVYCLAMFTGLDVVIVICGVCLCVCLLGDFGLFCLCLGYLLCLGFCLFWLFCLVFWV